MIPSEKKQKKNLRLQRPFTSNSSGPTSASVLRGAQSVRGVGVLFLALRSATIKHRPSLIILCFHNRLLRLQLSSATGNNNRGLVALSYAYTTASALAHSSYEPTVGAVSVICLGAAPDPQPVSPSRARSLPVAPNRFAVHQKWS